MDIADITVSFSNIASPSKQNPTILANEETDILLQSLQTNRHGEYTLLISFARDTKDDLILLLFLCLSYLFCLLADASFLL